MSAFSFPLRGSVWSVELIGSCEIELEIFVISARFWDKMLVNALVKFFSDYFKN